MSEKPKSTREKLFYAIVAPIVVAVAVFVIQAYVQGSRPLISFVGKDGVLELTNNSDELLRVRATYVFRRADGSEEFCFSPDFLEDRAEAGYPTEPLLPGETKPFPYVEERPSVRGAKPIRFGIRAWNSDNETVFQIDHWK